MNPRPVSLFAALALVPCVAFAEPSTAVKVQTVRVQKLAETATAYGQLVPNPGAFQWLSAAQSGRISAVLVTTGTRVKKGQALVRIAATPQTRAAYQTAQSDLAAARAKLKQTRTLYKNGLATRSDLAAARSAVANAEASLAALRAEGVGAHAQLIKALTAGVVTRLAVTRGEWVNAGTRIAALVPGKALWVRFGLTPEQAAKVAPGAPVRVEPVFGAGETLESRVAKVDAQADPTTGLIDAEVPLAAGESGPFSGEWVAGTITLRKVELPAVARSAVLEDAKGYYVFVVRKDVAHRLDVKPLVRARGLVGLAGIKPGETVVTQGNFELSDGDHVRITDKKDSAGPSPSASSSSPRRSQLRHAGESRHPVEKESRPAAGIPKFDWAPAFAGVTVMALRLHDDGTNRSFPAPSPCQGEGWGEGRIGYGTVFASPLIPAFSPQGEKGVFILCGYDEISRVSGS